MLRIILIYKIVHVNYALFYLKTSLKKAFFDKFHGLQRNCAVKSRYGYGRKGYGRYTYVVYFRNSGLEKTFFFSEQFNKRRAKLTPCLLNCSLKKKIMHYQHYQDEHSYGGGPDLRIGETFRILVRASNAFLIVEISDDDGLLPKRTIDL